MIHIYRATRGRYLKPVPVSPTQEFMDDDYNVVKQPKKCHCEYSGHTSRKLWYPTSEMFFQQWRLTKKELNQAIKDYDMASLEMRSRIICHDCADEILKQNVKIKKAM